MQTYAHQDEIDRQAILDLHDRSIPRDPPYRTEDERRHDYVFTLGGPFWFKVTMRDEDHGEPSILWIVVYTDEACTRVTDEDFQLERFSPEQRAEFMRALDEAQETANDIAAVEHSVDEFQATLRILDGSAP